jgi:hypothetical protein
LLASAPRAGASLASWFLGLRREACASESGGKLERSRQIIAGRFRLWAVVPRLGACLRANRVRASALSGLEASTVRADERQTAASSSKAVSYSCPDSCGLHHHRPQCHSKIEVVWLFESLNSCGVCHLLDRCSHSLCQASAASGRSSNSMLITRGVSSFPLLCFFASGGLTCSGSDLSEMQRRACGRRGRQRQRGQQRQRQGGIICTYLQGQQRVNQVVTALHSHTMLP